MRSVLLLLILCTCQTLQAQQVADTAFRFANPEPIYAAGNGPLVCVDGGHNNFHTIDGRYGPFADVVRSDGFEVAEVEGKLAAETIGSCRVLVIANPLGEETRDPSHLPQRSAFSSEEIDAVVTWVRDGGGLFMIIDHAPWPGAARDLASLFGILMLNGFSGAAREAPPAPTPFGDWGIVSEADWRSFGEAMGFPFETVQVGLENGGHLGDHAILRGRNSAEEIKLVVTFQGQTFYPAEGVSPLLVWGPDAIGVVIAQRGIDPTEWPIFHTAGWLQGGARQFGEGRVVVLGEAAACTAQVVGGRLKAGINAPVAPQNAQFCLNAVRWLVGALD